jgi:DNA-binding transcriptional regulator LsrR (DeoR family)
MPGEVNPSQLSRPSRRYDSGQRQRMADANRAAIIAAAKRHFLEEGYATTTLAAIAADAGVTRSTANRVLKRAQDDQIVDLTRAHVNVIDAATASRRGGLARPKGLT